MLTRLYIDNFRCFEKFEWRPGRKQLILGRNGTGKTSLMDALQSLSRTAAFGDRVEDWFKLNERTRWLNQRQQIFEIEAQLECGSYIYKLVIEPGGEPTRPRVQIETLCLNKTQLLRRAVGSAEPSDDEFPLNPSRAALSVLEMPNLATFREWLMQISCWHINPFHMSSRAEAEDPSPWVDLTNFADWYRHLVQTYPGENEAFLRDLRESLGGFDQLTLADAGENVQILYVQFMRYGKSIKISFGELSDGQRCLICLYAIVHFVVAKGGTVIIDEPDNFISLREIQPWLMALEDAVDDHGGQVILISHHPEILNQWANPYGVQFVREGAGPVRVQEFKGDTVGSLTAAEVVARGWDLE